MEIKPVIQKLFSIFNTTVTSAKKKCDRNTGGSPCRIPKALQQKVFDCNVANVAICEGVGTEN